MALDSIRGVAALSVVLYHTNWVSWIEEQSYVRNSYLMVDLFFVLSGFVIFYAYGKKIDSVPGFSRFMWLRFWRLYPLHFAFLIVWLIIELIKGIAEWRFGLVANHPAFSTNSIGAFVGNLFLVQSLHLYDATTFNYPAWSISTEFYTYILFGGIALSTTNKRLLPVWAALMCAVSLGALVWLGPDAITLTYSFGMVRCIFGFFLGILTFVLFEHLRTSSLVARNGRAMGYIALMALAAFAIFLALKTSGASDFAIYPFSAALILAVALAPPGGPTRFLRTKPFVWLGTVSYSIYMVHAAVEWCVKQVLRFVTHAKEIRLPLHDTTVLVPGATIGLCAAAATVAIVLLLSHFTFAWIERPFRDWSRSAWPGVRTRLALGLNTRG